MAKKFEDETFAQEKSDSIDIWAEKLRVELAKLGLKIIEDIHSKRVTNPAETYNSLVNLYNAVKK